MNRIIFTMELLQFYICEQPRHKAVPHRLAILRHDKEISGVYISMISWFKCHVMSPDPTRTEEEGSGAYLPAGQLGMLGGGAAVITFELVLGLFEEGVQAVP